ncbi:GNAT family N-acetyltransferase [Sulfitobacter sp. JB4-11]|uniref:GNAT family N-acetyltransferase n=1 Tax=Sulfitobacter rhodophyticola TaxID=3238304 RepID=UPI003D815FE0
MNAARIMQATDATWPAAAMWDADGFRLRDGQGGGQRVSAATALGTVNEAQVAAAEKAMLDKGQTALFKLHPGDDALDAMLAARGYVQRDKTVMYQIPIEALTDRPIPPVTAFTIWEPLAIMKEIWATDGIGPSRLAVMARTAVKTAIFARWNEKPAGAAFVALDGDVCMVHGLVVLPFQRRQGVAEWMMRRAAFWGREQGARIMSVLCVAENAPANALYRALGFAEAGQYHYRVLPPT